MKCKNIEYRYFIEDLITGYIISDCLARSWDIDNLITLQI